MRRTRSTLRLAVALWVAAVCLAASAAPSDAHAHAPGFGVLELRELPSGRVDALLRLSAGETSVAAIDVALPPHCVETERISIPRALGAELRWSATCGPRGLSGSTVALRGAIEPGTQLLIDVTRADGTEVRALADAHAPRARIPMPQEPTTFAETLARHAALGTEHVLLGLDHLLFVLGLLLLVRRGASRSVRPFVLPITAFTIGHSITLALATLDLIRVPAAPVECCIALSIVLLACELSRPPGAAPSFTARVPWLVAGAFGLLHGLGFAGALADAGLPAGELALALVGFNAGVELGQLTFVALVLLSMALASRSRDLASRAPRARAIATHAMGALAVFWALERALSLGG